MNIRPLFEKKQLIYLKIKIVLIKLALTTNIHFLRTVFYGIIRIV